MKKQSLLAALLLCLMALPAQAQRFEDTTIYSTNIAPNSPTACPTGQALTWNGTAYGCTNFPTCANNQTLTFNGTTFSCINRVASCNGANQVLRYIDATQGFSCVNIPVCGANQALSMKAAGFTCIDVAEKPPKCQDHQVLTTNPTTGKFECTRKPLTGCYIVDCAPPAKGGIGPNGNGPYGSRCQQQVSFTTTAICGKSNGTDTDRAVGGGGKCGSQDADLHCNAMNGWSGATPQRGVLRVTWPSSLNSWHVGCHGTDETVINVKAAGGGNVQVHSVNGRDDCAYAQVVCCPNQ